MGEFVRLEIRDGIGTIRLDRPPMNALNTPGAGGAARRGARAAAADAEVRAVIVYGGEKVFAAGADIKEMADMSYVDMAARAADAVRRVRRARPDPQAGRRRDHRVRPGRRLRAGPGLRLAGGGRGRQARPAGDQAGHHPGRRRHPAAGPAGRPGPRQGPDLVRPDGGRRRRRCGSGWPTGWCRPPRCTTTAVDAGPPVHHGPGPGRCARRSWPSTAAWRWTSPPAWPGRASSSRRCSPPTTGGRAWPRSSRSASPTSPGR